MKMTVIIYNTDERNCFIQEVDCAEEVAVITALQQQFPEGTDLEEDELELVGCIPGHHTWMDVNSEPICLNV